MARPRSTKRVTRETLAALIKARDAAAAALHEAASARERLTAARVLCLCADSIRRQVGDPSTLELLDRLRLAETRQKEIEHAQEFGSRLEAKRTINGRVVLDSGGAPICDLPRD